MSTSSSTKTRGSGVADDLDQLCPDVKQFNPEMLPLLKEVIGHVKYHVNHHSQLYKESIWTVSKTLHEHWVNSNVYPLTVKGIEFKLAAAMKTYRNLDRTHLSKRKDTWKNGKVSSPL